MESGSLSKIVNNSDFIKKSSSYVRVIVRRPHAYVLRRQYQTKFAIPGILILDAQKKVLWSGSVAEFKNNDKTVYGKSTNAKEKKVSFALHNIDRTRAVTHHDYMGKRIILNFFASWCPPCQKEIPHLNSYQKKLNTQKKDIQIIGILLDENLGGVPVQLR